MPKLDGPLAALQETAPRIDSLSLTATFATSGPERLAVEIESAQSASGAPTFKLSVAPVGARGPAAWRTRSKSLTRVIGSLAGKYSGIELPPFHIHTTGRGPGLAPATIQRLVLNALAQALGREPTGPEPGASGSSHDPAAWVAALRGGPDGLRRWNRLKAAERREIVLDGADLAGLDLAGANLRGVSLKGARLAGANLARAELGEAYLDGADFAGADLQEARLKGVRASGAAFGGAKLARAALGRGLFFEASFAGADLAGADLTDANLHRADLAGAILDGAVLEGASFDGRTAWPDGFAIPAEASFAGKGTDPRLVGKGKKAVARDIHGLMARLAGLIDPKRMKRTLDMLKSGKNQLFAEVEPNLVRGIVRSQREADLVYSCVLTDDGTYACCTPDLQVCLGLRGEPCKHLLVLLIGLARAGEIDPATIDPWVVAACGKNHRWNKKTQNHVSETLLRYKGVEAGEVDWRPTETLPEDFYAL